MVSLSLYNKVYTYASCWDSGFQMRTCLCTWIPGGDLSLHLDFRHGPGSAPGFHAGTCLCTCVPGGDMSLHLDSRWGTHHCTWIPSGDLSLHLDFRLGLVSAPGFQAGICLSIWIPSGDIFQNLDSIQ